MAEPNPVAQVSRQPAPNAALPQAGLRLISAPWLGAIFAGIFGLLIAFSTFAPRQEGASIGAPDVIGGGFTALVLAAIGWYVGEQFRKRGTTVAAYWGGILAGVFGLIAGLVNYSNAAKTSTIDGILTVFTSVMIAIPIGWVVARYLDNDETPR